MNQAKLVALKKEYEGIATERAQTQKKAEENEKLSLSIEKKVCFWSVKLKKQMLDLNKKMETEVSALSGDYDKLKSSLESYQMSLEKAMSRYTF